MKTKLLFLCSLSVLLFNALAAEPPALEKPNPGHFLAGEWNLDLYGTGTIANESRSADDLSFGGGLGANYWITRGLGFGLVGEADGFQHSVFDRSLGRVLVRAPLWDRIAPYGYAEGGYDFERQNAIAGAGGGLEFRLTKGWGLFGEAGLGITGEGQGSMKGKVGVRLIW